MEPQPDAEEKAEPVPSEPGLPEAGFQQQPPTLTIQNTVGGMPAVAAEGELADRSLDPAGELPQSCWPRAGLGQCSAAS